MPAYPYPPLDPAGGSDPAPAIYEPKSFADVLIEELAVLEKRREMIYRRSRLEADRDALARETAPEPMAAIREFRQAHRGADEDKCVSDARVEALGKNLAGLAFSGGGIRSATFAVGILQGLAQLKLLRYFDILSTVSGGGYAGAWLAAWIRREGDPVNVELQLDVSRIEQNRAVRATDLGGETVLKGVVDEEPEPVRHLRRYSSYMNPEPGLFTADTWTLLAIYSRNVLINLMLLAPMVASVVLLTRLLVLLYHHVALLGDATALSLAFFWAGVALVFAALCIGGVALKNLRDPDVKRAVGVQIVYLEILLLVVASVLLTTTYQPILDLVRETMRDFFLGFGSGREGAPGGVTGFLADRVGPGALDRAGYLSTINLVGHAAFFGCLLLVLYLVVVGWVAVKTVRRGDGALAAAPKEEWLQEWRAVVASGAIGGLLVAVTEAVLRPAIVGQMPELLALVGPPLFLLDAVVSLSALAALTAKSSGEAEREWAARVSALLLMVIVAWVVFVGVILYGPAVVLGGPRLVAAALASGWLGLTAAGVRAGGSALTSGRGGGRVMELVAGVAPPVFLVGLLAFASTLISLRVDSVDAVSTQPTFGAAFAAYAVAVRHAEGWPLFRWLVVSALSLVAASLYVNVNLFSLHAMYANRLTRAFLGASRRRGDWEGRWTDVAQEPWGEVAKFRDQRVLAGAPTRAVQGGVRDPNPVTQFDPQDDLDLVDLAVGAGDDKARYWGPHVIFNTALNLVGGGELAWRDRKAESFALTPVFCGAKTTGYARTSEETRTRLTVGRAVAVSGAAVDPNMNYHQSASVTALLTIFNARLGVWVQNPNRNAWPVSFPNWEPRGKPWSARSASFSFLLFKELLGRTDQRQRYVHLSDGGHFDNLGVYELVKRRCRYIVAVDAAENPKAAGDNLGTLVRLCRVDLGVRIQLDTSPLKVEGVDGLSRSHVVVGRVRYDDVDNGQTPGVLVYVKSTMTGDEPTDVRQYADLHPEFPRQSTLGDQSFDEDQFESYRALGVHTAVNVFGAAAQSVFEEFQGDVESWWKDPAWSGAGDAFAQGHRKIFSALRNRWTEPPAVEDGQYAESIRSWFNLQTSFRKEWELAEFARDLYSELPALRDNEGAAVADRRKAELHAMEQALQLMAETWSGLGLRGKDDAPVGRGWLNTFRRLAGSEPFRLYWPLLRPQFSAEFVRFCERQLRLRVAPPFLQNADRTAAEDLNLLARDFAREWTGVVGRGRGETLAEAGERHVAALVANAAMLPLDSGKMTYRAAWVIVQTPIEYEPTKEFGFALPVGLVVLSPAGPAKDLYELLFWVGRAHRSVGIGEKVRRSPQVKNLISSLNVRKAKVRVRYPEIKGDGGEDLNRVRWLGFFSLLDFKPDKDQPLLSDQEWNLYKTYG